LQFGKMVEGCWPIGEVGVAAIAGGLVFDEVAREDHAGVGHHRDHVAGGMAAPDMQDPHFAPAEPDR